MKSQAQDTEPARPASTWRQASGWLRLTTAEFTFHAAALVWLITCATLWVAGHALARFAPAPMPDVVYLSTLFVPWATHGLAPEPQERRVYLVLTLLAPLVILAVWAGVRRMTTGRTGPTFAPNGTRFSDWTIAGAALVFLFGGTSLYLALTAVIVGTVLQPVATSGLLPTLGIALACWWALGCGMRHYRHRWPLWRRAAKIWRAGTLAGALSLAAGIGIVVRVFDDFTAPHANAVPTNTVLYPIAQAVNGLHLLADYLPQYGYFGEFLKPWLSLIGLSVVHVTATLAALQSLSLVAVVFTLSKLLRSRLLLCLTTVAFAWLMQVWAQFSTVPPHTALVLRGFDPYYQYFPIRLLCPALSLLAVWWYLRRPTQTRAATLGAFGGLASWWNVDTGTVVLASFLILLTVKACSEWSALPLRNRWQAGRHLLIATGAAALALGGFFLVLCLEARQMVNPIGAIRYQQIFYISGFFMAPMPLTLSCWHVVIGVYLLGLTHGLKRTLVSRSLFVYDGFVLYLSVLGLGLFSYYQGRSLDAILVDCGWPAFALAMLLCDRLFAATRYGLLPRLYTAAALPILTLGTACALCLWFSGRSVMATETTLWQAHVNRVATPQTDAVEYLKRSVPHGESSAVISPYQAIYAAETGLRSSLTGPSIFECLLIRDETNLYAQLKARRVQHVFTEDSTYPEAQVHPLGQGFLDTLEANYHLTGSNPKGNLMHWEPRLDGAANAFPKVFAARTRLRVSPPTVRHALRFAAPNVLLNAQGRCVGVFPNELGNIVFGSSFAIEMIVTPAQNQPDFACLLSNHPGTAYDGLTVQRDGSKAADTYVGNFGNGHQFTTSAPFALPAGAEHYLVVSGEAATVSIYIDGRLNQQFQLPGPMVPSVTPLTVGDWMNGDRRFAGEIAEVKVHDQALSAAIVTSTWQLMTADSKSGFTSPSPGP